TAALRVGWNGGDERDALRDACSLVAAKQEKLVADERTAGGSAELILAESREAAAGDVIEKIVGVENVVAEKFEYGAVEIVGAGFESGVDHRASVTPKFGAEVIVLHLEFLKCVDGRGDRLAGKRLQVEHVGIVVYAVEQEIVVQRAGSVG